MELAVKPVKNGQGVGAVAKDLELVEQVLRNWMKAAKAGKLNAPGSKAVTPEQMEQPPSSPSVAGRTPPRGRGARPDRGPPDADKRYPHDGTALEVTGEEIKEQLDILPAKLERWFVMCY